jgi:RNA polymerase sigma factor (sigma-70 family)
MQASNDRREWVLAALDKHERRLTRYAERLLGDLDQARDVVQFVFLRLCEQSPDQLDDRLAQWLFTVCRNRAMDVLRGNGKAVGWDKAAAADGPPFADHDVVGRRDLQSLVPPYSRETDPADSAEQVDLHVLLRSLVDELPASQREALDLWAEGFSYLEISRITDRQEGHIRVLVHRGLKALREHPRVRALMDEPADEHIPINDDKVVSPVHGASH